MGCVDPIPNANEATVLDLNVELLASHDCQQLCGCGETASLVQQCNRIGMHGASMRWLPRIGQSPLGITREETQNRARKLRAMRFCVCSRLEGA